MESFFKALKVERIYQTRYETRAQARLDIGDWIEGYYNRQRLHTSIDFLTPVEYESSCAGINSALYSPSIDSAGALRIELLTRQPLQIIPV